MKAVTEMKVIRLKNQLFFTAIVLSSTVLSGCTTHRVDSKPNPSISSLATYSVNSEDSFFQKTWWENFNRPLLDSLIQQSLTNNLDIAQAVAVLNQTQAMTTQRKSERLPLFNLNADTNRRWEGSKSFDRDSNIGAAFTWEVDVWNRIGSGLKADLAEVRARAADIDTVKLTLSAEVTNAYFGAAAANEQISLLNLQLTLDKELGEILQLRLDNGIGNNVDVLQQQARIADSETLIPIAEADLAVFENRLDVLMGQAPDGKYRVPKNETLNFIDKVPEIGVPAGLLLNRPDLIAAQADLVAADASVAEAIADRFPRITISGSSVYNNNDGFNGPASLLIGSFVQPLLDWGQRKAEIERNRALYQEQLAAYTQRYLEAIEDVENSLIQEIKQREFLSKLDVQRNILLKTVNAAESRHKQGIDDYQPVIAALQELRAIERNLVDEKLNLLNLRVDLFRAIGGPIKPNKVAVKAIIEGKKDETL